MLTLSNVTKHYKMGDSVVRALDGISLTIDEGDFTAIVGPSGSGKSTLMNIIGCLDIVTDGEYVLNQIPIKKYEEDELAEIRNKQIGFVFQQFNLLPSFSALENVMMPMTYARVPKKQREKIAAEILTKVGLGDRMDHKPTELSGGQQQRVSIARALANNPAIILADEPTGALDQKTGKEVLDLLTQLNKQGKTVIVITHDVGVAAYASRILTIRDGKIVDDSRKEADHV
ncbi:MAG: macrolide ABC transporter ATP-binding protein [Firmicutes bacterium GWF2_51_9]|nr:MAG: macrolide ABC transporter ATP-binding protein [Firmicutes bacterium GWF2_51_9]OGS58892.1 MAG: macrolide ABC transporter ATP-binding protein [Firmicutes bacterium GWE2_51_13]HAM63507.1 macrolide ABC transporter ATP-binding protein [Erysipelotrichaceae bacterium]HBZ42190.1 macrolide ABC transporter ATP-binding protein [Erysipelotrichaceae bacterium]